MKTQNNKTTVKTEKMKTKPSRKKKKRISSKDMMITNADRIGIRELRYGLLLDF